MTTASVVLSVMERLDYLLLAEGAAARCSGDLRNQVVQLQSNLSRIEQFLSVAGSKNDGMEDFTKKVTRLACDIEDSVDSYAQQDAASERRPGVFRRWFFQMDLYTFWRRINDLINFMGGRAERDAPAAGGIGESSSSISTSSGGAPVNHDVVVGMDADSKGLKSLLLEGQSELSVIGICGVGGSGKTTLAQLVYSEPSVAKHFDRRAWVTVGTDVQARDIFETLLLSLMSSSARSKEEIEKMETMELMDQVYKAQKGMRYLVVLDNVWSTEAWDTIRSAFPNDRNGSRVVITTRYPEVAANITTCIHMTMLSEDESWELLQMISRPWDSDEQHNPEKVTIGRQIARECRGLPLAISVIGGILKGKNLKYWDAVLRRMPKIQADETIKDILGLSYDELPIHLKPCFLYLGLFPPHQAILVDKLYSLWTAEGLISMRALNTRARLEVAEDYFNELVDRNLVIMVEKEVSASRRFESCQIHDLIRDFCISKAKQEGFLEVVHFGDGNQISSLTSKVAIYLNNFEDRNDAHLQVSEPKYIRSILFLGADESLPQGTWPQTLSGFNELEWTRVLGFDGVDFGAGRFPRATIKKLTYLRHLSFRGCYLQQLPANLSSFSFLETLDLRVRIHCRMIIPNVLRKISSLRHLYFPLAFRSATRSKLKLDRLKKLETLENFHAGICDVDDLVQLKNLQFFTGIAVGNNIDLKKISSFMHEHPSCKSSLVVKKFDSYSNERLSIVAELLEREALRALDIEGYLGKLPLQERIGSNLTEMVFNGSEFPKDPMPILGKLQCLRSLVLCNNAFVGGKMECSKSDFPHLKSLKLATLQSLEKWEVEIGAIPSLTILTIEQCNKLEILPHGLKEIPTLQKLRIGSMPEGFQNQVNNMIERRDNSIGKLTATFYDC